MTRVAYESSLIMRLFGLETFSPRTFLRPKSDSPWFDTLRMLWISLALWKDWEIGARLLGKGSEGESLLKRYKLSPSAKMIIDIDLDVDVDVSATF